MTAVGERKQPGHKSQGQGPGSESKSSFGSFGFKSPPPHTPGRAGCRSQGPPRSRPLFGPRLRTAVAVHQSTVRCSDGSDGSEPVGGHGEKFSEELRCACVACVQGRRSVGKVCGGRTEGLELERAVDQDGAGHRRRRRRAVRHQQLQLGAAGLVVA